MSESVEEIKTENEPANELEFNQIVNNINSHYLSFLSELQEKFKFHESLLGNLEYDIKNINNNLEENSYYILNSVTDNFLFCLEQICDENSDYFLYQVEKIKKKNNKIFKNRLPRFGSKTLFKKVLSESDHKYHSKIFKSILDIFTMLVYKNEEGHIFFLEDYIEYVKDNYTENKNFSKMLIVLDNVNDIFYSESDNKEEEIENYANQDEKDSSSETKKETKKKSKGKSKEGPDFMKNLENSKIGQLAKNISEKINIDDYPDLKDPSKLLSSFTNPSGNQEGDAGIQNLLKFVMDEVQGAFKDNTLNQNDLIQEAHSMMGALKDISGIDPVSLLGKDGPNLANIFSKMSK
jgi:hypothetical protein